MTLPWLQRVRRILPALLLLPGIVLAGEQADDSAGTHLARTRWFGYVGGFFVTSITTQLSVFSTDVPIGARVDLLSDLGLDDALIVPRIDFAWNFKPRHVVAFGYYDLTQSSTKIIDRTIDIGDVQFDIDTKVFARFKNGMLRAQYTWLFHTDEKVELGIGGGLFIANLGIRVSAVESAAGELETNEGVTAPLPVIGARFSYAIAPRLRFLLSTDLFVLNYGPYNGTLLDSQAILSHRTTRHVGFVAGLNFQTLNAQFDDGEFDWELTNGFRGIFAGVSFYF